MPIRNASATWEGGLRGGDGSFRGESGEIEGRYTFGSRFEEAGGTNPDELLAASLASCYSMALAGALEKQGTPAERVRTEAACVLEKVGEGYEITRLRLRVHGRAPGMEEDAFRRTAEELQCPVSKALGAVKMEVEASLE